MNDHPMSEPAVRSRVAIMLTVLIALAWALITMMGRATGPYAASELPDLAGLPVLVPQIQRIVPPRDLMPGGLPDAAPTPAPPQPTEGAP